MYILTGSIAFIFLFFFDVFTLTNNGIRKKIFGMIGLGLLIYSAVMITVTSDKLDFPFPLRIAALVLWLAATFLLVYSLFLELPFVKTYGKDQHSNILVDTGTYALCRHPGVLWFGMMFFFFFFATGAVQLIYAGIVWTCLDVLHVYLQEKLFFPKMFPDYNNYIKTVPMLIPTVNSIKKCIATLF